MVDGRGELVVMWEMVKKRGERFRGCGGGLDI